MMKTLPEGFSPFDAADYLESEYAIKEFINSCSECGGPRAQ